MSTIKNILPLLLSALGVSLSFSQTKNMNITLKGIEEIKGQIVVLVFDNEEDFPKDQDLAKQFTFPVTKKEMVLSLQELPLQDCAVMLYHDKDKNNKCNQNFIGMPTEKIGFSNNIKPKLKAPKFKEAKVEPDETQITIELYKM
ncbi:DUF2141 domain-containing protein [Paludibacteraceae bacterium OttesenSCG-928-F17]|nr:DUF2141 domain-containing protein [Paludibacteraceae bacterium OttesenSCG-928-F17]